MSLQSQFKSKDLLEKIEPLTVIKNEPEFSMNQDIISPNIKDEIDIVYHIIPEDLIKSEPIPNLLKSEHFESVETQIFVQTENTPFNKTEFENLVKTEDNSDEHLSVEEIQKSTPNERKAKLKIDELSHKTQKDNRHLKYRCKQCKYKTFHLGDFKKHKILHLKPEEVPYFYCYHCSYKCKQKNNLKIHIFKHFKNEQVLFHCYICDFVTVKRDFIIEHFKKHPEHRSKCDETDYKINLKLIPKIKKRYHCKKCAFSTYQQTQLKQHELSHETESDDRHLKYRCDQCKYKTHRLGNFNMHNLLHLKPEQIPYFYCYHCSYKCKQKNNLKIHIFKHFKNEEVQFHCYICDFVTVKRDLIIEHFKKHPEHRIKCDETEYENFLESYTKKIISTYQHEKLKPQELFHETDRDDRHLQYRCDQCKYRTFHLGNFKKHKILHLKPEEIPHFYCYHCFYKCKQKNNLKNHIFRHFKNEEVRFHCYICDFVTVKKGLIIEHLKKHPEHCSKCDETEYKNLLESYTKKGIR